MRVANYCNGTILILVHFGLIAAFAPIVSAADKGARAEYIGGTVPDLSEKEDGRIVTTNNGFIAFRKKGGELRVPYDRINLIEYGQKVDRRYLEAVILSPMFLLSKRRAHFLTLGYSDEDGHQQAMVFKVNKSDIRTILVSLEARTGRKVQYQDDEARKAGKG